MFTQLLISSSAIREIFKDSFTGADGSTPDQRLSDILPTGSGSAMWAPLFSPAAEIKNNRYISNYYNTDANLALEFNGLINPNQGTFVMYMYGAADNTSQPHSYGGVHFRLQSGDGDNLLEIGIETDGRCYCYIETPDDDYTRRAFFPRGTGHKIALFIKDGQMSFIVDGQVQSQLNMTNLENLLTDIDDLKVANVYLYPGETPWIYGSTYIDQVGIFTKCTLADIINVTSGTLPDISSFYGYNVNLYDSFSDTGVPAGSTSRSINKINYTHELSAEQITTAKWIGEDYVFNEYTGEGISTTPTYVGIPQQGTAINEFGILGQLYLDNRYDLSGSLYSHVLQFKVNIEPFYASSYSTLTASPIPTATEPNYLENITIWDYNFNSRICITEGGHIFYNGAPNYITEYVGEIGSGAHVITLIDDDSEIKIYRGDLLLATYDTANNSRGFSLPGVDMISNYASIKLMSIAVLSGVDSADIPLLLLPFPASSVFTVPFPPAPPLSLTTIFTEDFGSYEDGDLVHNGSNPTLFTEYTPAAGWHAAYYGYPLEVNSGDATLPLTSANTSARMFSTISHYAPPDTYVSISSISSPLTGSIGIITYVVRFKSATEFFVSKYTKSKNPIMLGTGTVGIMFTSSDISFLISAISTPPDNHVCYIYTAPSFQPNRPGSFINWSISSLPGDYHYQGDISLSVRVDLIDPGSPFTIPYTVFTITDLITGTSDTFPTYGATQIFMGHVIEYGAFGSAQSYIVGDEFYITGTNTVLTDIEYAREAEISAGIQRIRAYRLNDDSVDQLLPTQTGYTGEAVGIAGVSRLVPTLPMTIYLHASIFPPVGPYYSGHVDGDVRFGYINDIGDTDEFYIALQTYRAWSDETNDFFISHGENRKLALYVDDFNSFGTCDVTLILDGNVVSTGSLQVYVEEVDQFTLQVSSEQSDHQDVKVHEVGVYYGGTLSDALALTANTVTELPPTLVFNDIFDVPDGPNTSLREIATYPVGQYWHTFIAAPIVGNELQMTYTTSGSDSMKYVDTYDIFNSRNIIRYPFLLVMDITMDITVISSSYIESTAILNIFDKRPSVDGLLFGIDTGYHELILKVTGAYAGTGTTLNFTTEYTVRGDDSTSASFDGLIASTNSGPSAANASSFSVTKRMGLHCSDTSTLSLIVDGVVIDTVNEPDFSPWVYYRNIGFQTQVINDENATCVVSLRQLSLYTGYDLVSATALV